ncbi:exported hypothetical protein [Desulfamplus magnetovallimortis]|uniref:Lcl C-terminal domain-containing protein n=1 Tax=Desulfamplus magnetovallimortis TaxID=1246637 RepID=A0A1W1HG51_9BACT|nr:DUF1566 domain-containing protein [Desulfamplus magnetovallimortis]SLM31416.1 exported hypothetical protein [Desulfamplus magnetovallimortis]
MNGIKTTLCVSLSLLCILISTVAHAVGPYVDNADGTITDEGTGLMWQQTDDGIRRNWEDACQACEELELAGYNDWRAPRVDELRSIIDYNSYLPAMDLIFSVESDWTLFWSGSDYANGTVNAWQVYFYDGSVSTGTKTSRSYIRCVRSGPFWSLDPLDNLVINSEEVAEDIRTGAKWQREDDGVKRTWEDACQYCENLVLDGESGWRIPEIEELASIVDYTKYNPSISVDIFENTQSLWYWSGSSDADETDSAWYIDFYNGTIKSFTKSGEYHVRCILAEKTDSETELPSSGNAPEIRMPFSVEPSIIEAGAGQEVTFLVSVYDPDGADDIESVVLKHALLDSILGEDGVEMTLVEPLASDTPFISTYQYKTTLLSGLSPQNYIVDVVALDSSGLQAVETTNFSVIQKRRATIENKESFSEKVQNRFENQTLEISVNVGQGMFGTRSSITSTRLSSSLSSGLLRADTPVTPGAEKCGDCYVEVMIYRPDKTLYNIEPYIVCDSENITIENAESGEWTYETTSHCASSLDVEIETRGADTAVLTGTVKDSITGKSVSGARVQWNLGGETFSSENGYFSTVVVAGEGLVTTSLANYQTNLKAKVLLGSGETKKILISIVPEESSCIKAPDKPIVELIASPMTYPDPDLQPFAAGVVDSNLVFSALFPPYDQNVNIYLGITTDVPGLSSYLFLFDSNNLLAPMAGTPVAWREVKEACQWLQEEKFLSIPLELLPKGKYTFYSLVTAEPDGMPTFEIRYFSLDL